MLAPNLNGDEILSAAKRFFPGRLRRWQLGPRSAENRKVVGHPSGEDFGLLVGFKTTAAPEPKPESQEKEK
jgi:hypothetical protein